MPRLRLGLNVPVFAVYDGCCPHQLSLEVVITIAGHPGGMRSGADRDPRTDTPPRRKTAADERRRS